MTEVQDPFEILEGMRQIALADMMDTVGYITTRVARPDRRNSICRGHKACAVGSTWLAAGVTPRRLFPDEACRQYYLPGVEQGSERTNFLARRPALRRAFAALNAAAAEYLDRHGIYPNAMYDAPLEALFESKDRKLDGGERRRAMLRVIASAKRKLAVSGAGLHSFASGEQVNAPPMRERGKTVGE